MNDTDTAAAAAAIYVNKCRAILQEETARSGGAPVRRLLLPQPYTPTERHALHDWLDEIYRETRTSIGVRFRE